MPATAEQRFAGKIVRQLKRDFPEVECALNFSNPLELLIATILSAQTTDKQVNVVTEKLFQQYKTAEDYANAELEDLETVLNSIGCFRVKAKNVRGCCQKLLDQHNGTVPKKLDQLVPLPGVGRKTANVVLGTAYGIASGVVVDTHVGRLSYRLGLTEQTDPIKIERDLMALLPKKEWIGFSHRLIWHGRKVCKARKPICKDCSLAKLCPRNGLED